MRSQLALHRCIVVLSGVLGAWALPLPAQAQMCTPFTDVFASDPLCSNIQWMFNRGITLGCPAPPGQTWYCPAHFVRRDQMAAFMNRLGDVSFQQGGNAFGATAVLGTTDENPLDVRVEGRRVMRYEPDAISPNVIGGSPANVVTDGVHGATIAGGGAASGTDPDFLTEGPNRVTDSYGTVTGGYDNRAGDDAGGVVGAALATVGGGVGNIASGFGSTIGGGGRNVASGSFSTVGGGESNTASGTHSVAAGYRAKATATGSFTWADRNDFDFEVPVSNFFGARATGGVGFTVAINPGSGVPTQFCDLRPNIAGWQCVSDRNVKENFVPARGEEILAKLAAMPLFSWNFKGADPRIRNLGPTAQDFKAAFGLGTEEKMIASGNLHGVALVAIQGLNAKLEAKVAEQARELAALREAHADQIAELKRAVEVLLARTAPGPRVATSR